jgi:peroxiredoxin
MAALEVGTTAPEISLPLLNGGKFSLNEAAAHGPVLAAFFKVSCPVCQLAFPYLQRIYTSYGGPNVTMIGISQDNAADTAAFARQYGVKFPIALDDTKKYPASNAYGLTNVPSLFWITPDKKIEISSVGWSKHDIRDLNSKIALAAGKPAVRVFNPGENVPEFKAG